MNPTTSNAANVAVHTAIDAAELALVAAAGGWTAAAVAPPWAYAVVASKFLAASSPHSLGMYWCDEAWGTQHAAATMTGFAAVFHPRDVRIAHPVVGDPMSRATAATTRQVRYRDIMAADVVIHVGDAPEAITPRSGSHVIWVGTKPPPFEPAHLRSDTIFAAITTAAPTAWRELPPPWHKLSDIVAGRIDGRQLDEITVTWLCMPAS